MPRFSTSNGVAIHYEADDDGRPTLILSNALSTRLEMWDGILAAARAHFRVVRNTAALMPPPEAWDGRIATVAAGGMAAVAEGTLARWFTASFREAEPQTVRRIAAMIEATAVAGYSGCCAAIRDMDQRPALAGIPVPTLVLTGADDPGTAPSVAYEMAGAIPNARVEILERCAHLSAVERPDAFAAAVLPFLAA